MRRPVVIALPLVLRRVVEAPPRWLAPAVAAVLAGLALVVLLGIFNGAVEIHAEDLLEDAFPLLGGLLAAWWLLAVLPIKGRVPVQVLVPALLVATLAFGAVQLVARREAAIGREIWQPMAGATDAEYLEALTANSRWYPSEAFLAAAAGVIPEDEAVLYIGNYRPDPFSAALHPRPVYALPALQRATIAGLMEGWSPEPDPAHPRGYTATFPAMTELPGDLREQVEALVRERDIRWVIEADLADPAAARLYRIAQ